MKETSKSISHKSMSLLLVFPVLFMYSFSCLSLLSNCTYKNLNSSLFYSSYIPNDDYYSLSWHLNKIEAEKAWDITCGFPSVKVGIIDSGIDSACSDLTNNIDYCLSHDCYSEIRNSPLTDTIGHGTSVATIVGAVGDNDNDFAGLTWHSKLVSLRNDNDDDSDCQAAINAINYASINDIPILNLSSRFMNNIEGDLIDDLDCAINNYDGLLITCSGNDSSNIDTNQSSLCYPQNLTEYNIIVVGASNQADQKCLFSNYGLYSVDLFAPGISIPSYHFVDENEPLLFTGTSASAPIVAGTAALIKSVNPNLSAAQIKTIILNTVDYSEALNGLCVSNGRLNAYKAVKEAIPSYNVPLSTVMPSIQNLSQNQHQFYKTTLQSGTYTFDTSGLLDLSVNVYSNIQNLPIAQSTNTTGNCSFDFTINSSGTYYFKVKNTSLFSGNYSIRISPNPFHTHSYDSSYNWFDSRRHRAYCSCQLSTLQPHFVTSDDLNTCIFCGGYAEFGMIGPLTFSNNFGNDSMLLPNGIVLLGNVDNELISNGILTPNQLLQMGGNFS